MKPNTELIDLINDLSKADTKDNIEFARFFSRAMDVLALDVTEIALEFSASRPTVTRWRNAVNAPHPAMRASIYAFFLTKALGAR
jgi:hypothetical protein